MATVNFEHVYKIYPNGYTAIKDLNLEIKDGEFLVFVGPSGCGKSTAMRMLAGLEDISAGKLLIGDQVVNDKTPQERNIAMVFQNYALYPHMSVRQNLEFPLRMVNMPKQQIQGRVVEAAEKLGLTPLLERKPKQLSGGQRQRVAMGRAIVRDPSVFLMDEPLSNLDAKMRTQIRTEIADLQRKMGTTTVYVTHDQVEAMTMGDRVVVMRGGELQQIATPQDLYDTPANIFVASFMGSPAMNLFQTHLRQTAEGPFAIDFGPNELEIAPPTIARYPNLGQHVGQPLIAGLRPEAFSLATPDAPPQSSIEVELRSIEALGHEMILHAEAPLTQVVVTEGQQQEQSQQFNGSNGSNSSGRSILIARIPSSREVHDTKHLRLSVDSSKLYLFTAQGEAIASQ
jgi:multiple sugar transport system ATP-binding protein